MNTHKDTHTHCLPAERHSSGARARAGPVLSDGAD